MIDHVGFPVSDFSRSLDFYQHVLKPLGCELVMRVTPEQSGSEAHAGFGHDGKPAFWIGTGEAIQGRLHVAFTAASREAVDAFHATALACGGHDNGKPGLRPHYHPDYYGAFVLDPDGHNIEAVCHQPTTV